MILAAFIGSPSVGKKLLAPRPQVVTQRVSVSRHHPMVRLSLSTPGSLWSSHQYAGIPNI
jgi:hypothetical protein